MHKFPQPNHLWGKAGAPPPPIRVHASAATDVKREMAANKREGV